MLTIPGVTAAPDEGRTGCIPSPSFSLLLSLPAGPQPLLRGDLAGLSDKVLPLAFTLIHTSAYLPGRSCCSAETWPGGH